MFIVGGAGAYMDLGGNRSVRPLIELIAALRRPVVAICYGVAVLIQATHPLTKMPLVWGRLITGHSEEDDYTDGTTDVDFVLKTVAPGAPSAAVFGRGAQERHWQRTHAHHQL